MISVSIRAVERVPMQVRCFVLGSREYFTFCSCKLAIASFVGVLQEYMKRDI